MTEENVMTTENEDIKGINTEVLNMEPTKVPVYTDDVLLDWVPLDEKTVITDTEDTEIIGSFEQRREMFADWSRYIGEVQNPNTTAENPFFKKPDGSKSLYAPLDEVLNSTRPILAKYGFGMIQIPGTKTGQASIKVLITHKSGGFFSFPRFTVPISKNDAQGIIAGITYARRGGLNPILGIHGEVDDDGNEAAGAKPTVKEETKPALPVEVLDKQKEVIALAKELIDDKVDREVVNKALMDTCKSKNPNSVKEMKLLESAYTALDEIRNGMKKEGK